MFWRIPTRMYDKSKVKEKVEIRLGKEQLSMIDDYCKNYGVNRSQAIREIIENGMRTKANMALSERFSANLLTKWLEIQPKITYIINQGESLIFVRDHFICQKCHTDKELIIYNIDRDPLNHKAENLITLCKTCASKVEKYTPKWRVVEDFVEWFYLL
jgi:metal-responsive CopG/Arc/MetJ family transcriptional regulator